MQIVYFIGPKSRWLCSLVLGCHDVPYPFRMKVWKVYNWGVNPLYLTIWSDLRDSDEHQKGVTRWWAQGLPPRMWAQGLPPRVDITWKMKRALGVGSEAKLKKNIKVIDDFVYKLISSKAEKMHESHDDLSLKKEDILSRFLQLNEADPKYLRDIILNFIIAGKDTTATTLSWFVYMLCKHPLVQEKVAKEIENATESDDAAGISEFAASLSQESLEKMHYLHAALTETLRLYPAVPVDAKICFSDDILPDGYHVKRGDMVSYLPYAMGRMRFIWGDDAQDFKPERWLNDNGCFRPESPFKFTAFQAGPRICLGKEFAYRQMKIFSAVLLRFFIFELNDERRTVKYRTMINLHIDGGLCVRAFHRLRHAKAPHVNSSSNTYSV